MKIVMLALQTVPLQCHQLRPVGGTNIWKKAFVTFLGVVGFLTSSTSFSQEVSLTVSTDVQNMHCYGSTQRDQTEIRSFIKKLIQSTPTQISSNLVNVNIIKDVYKTSEGPLDDVISLGTCGTWNAPFQGDLQSLNHYSANIAHEWGHVIFGRILRDRLAQESCQYPCVDEFLIDSALSVRKPINELFADLFAAMVHNDPDVMSRINAEWGFVASEGRTFSKAIVPAGKSDNMHNALNNLRPLIWAHARELQRKRSLTDTVEILAKELISMALAGEQEYHRQVTLHGTESDKWQGDKFYPTLQTFCEDWFAPLLQNI
jgi:hypothetical protein